MKQESEKVICIPAKMERTEMIFHSVKECAEHFLMDESKVRYLIESGKCLKQYYFDYLEE